MMHYNISDKDEIIITAMDLHFYNYFENIIQILIKSFFSNVKIENFIFNNHDHSTRFLIHKINMI